MRSYKQYCGLAKALDVVGDRWTLLIVRELLIRGPCRYTDLRKGLPGIATNLLADRLRELTDVGVVIAEEAPPPIATTLFHLAPRGQELEPAIQQLGLWGAPLLGKNVPGEDLQAHWLVLPLKALLADTRSEDPDVRMQLQTGGELITVSAIKGAIDVRLGRADDPDVVVSGKPKTILQLFTGRINLRAAEAAGLRWQGARELLHRVVPATPNALGRC